MFRSFEIFQNLLSHCGLLTPSVDIDLGQRWLREWLVAWCHQAIIETNFDLSLVKLYGTHLRAISQWDYYVQGVWKLYVSLALSQINSLGSGQLVDIFQSSSKFILGVPRANTYCSGSIVPSGLLLHFDKYQLFTFWATLRNWNTFVVYWYIECLRSHLFYNLHFKSISVSSLFITVLCHNSVTYVVLSNNFNCMMLEKTVFYTCRQ